MKDKHQLCPHCNSPMKYRGNRQFECKVCHRRFSMRKPFKNKKGLVEEADAITSLYGGE